MANIHPMGEGRNKRYKVTYEINTPDGTRRRKSKTFPAGTPKAVAEEFKRKMEQEYVLGELELQVNRPKAMTLKEFYENVYIPEFSLHLSPTTLKNYKRLWQSQKGDEEGYSICTRFGDWFLKKITRSDVQKYVNELVRKGLSSKTVRSYHSFLSAVIDKAVLCDHIPYAKNPMKGILLPPREYTEKETFTVEQAKQLIEAARNKSINDLLIVQLGLLAGLRRSEIAGLRWEDWEGNILRVRQAKVYGDKDKKTVIKSTKTRSGVRNVAIGQDLQRTLQAAKTDYYRRKLMFGSLFKNSGYVLTNEDGSDKTTCTISTIYQRLIQSMPDDFPKLGLHCLRHTFATLMITGARVDVKTASQMLGHSTTQMTLDIYTHGTMDGKQQAAEGLDELLSKTN